MPEPIRIWWVQAVALASLAACGSDSTSPGPPDIDGLWRFTETLDSPGTPLSCENSGSFGFTQSDTTFIGGVTRRATCTVEGETVEYEPFAGAIGGGRVTEAGRISFSAAGCAYEGAVIGSPADRMEGEVDCNLAPSGRVVSLVGAWSAAR